VKGIILAGGTGSRLYPLTLATSKQLLPVYDKPMIYYPLSTLMLAGVTEILVITTPHEQEQFLRLLGDGSQFGITINYAVQTKPNGIAEAFLIAEDYLAGEPVCLILGDNIFYGPGMGTALSQNSSIRGARIFTIASQTPERFGVINFDSSGRPISIEEKPAQPITNLVIPGIYFFDETASERAKLLRPSGRHELEITDLLRSYLDEGLLLVENLGHKVTWVDSGTIESLNEAADLIRTIEENEKRKINVPEEIAWRLGLIDKSQLENLISKYGKSDYGAYLTQLASVS